MKSFPLLIVTALTLLVGFTNPAMADDDLLGTWQLELKFEEVTVATIRYTFQAEGVLAISATSQGETESFTASYSVEGANLTIQLPANIGGERVTGTYSIANDQLTYTPAGAEAPLVMERVPATE